MNSSSVSDETLRLSSLAVEYWKVCRALERAIELVPENHKARLRSQVRYSADRLSAILAEQEISIVDFDGRTFEIGLAASAVNADEFVNEEDLVVEKTLEPAVVAGTQVLSSGKVYLKRA